MMASVPVATAGDMGKSRFVAAALQELRVGLCKGNYLIHWALLGVLAGGCAWELMGPLRTCVISGALRATGCLPCWALFLVYACVVSILMGIFS
jgi:hypothetical protein